MRHNRKKGLAKKIKIPLVLIILLGLAAAGLHISGQAPWQGDKAGSLAPTPVPVVRAKTEPEPVRSINLNSGQVLAQGVGITAVTPNERLYLDKLHTVTVEAGRLFSFNEWTAGLQKSGDPELSEKEASRLAGLIYEAAVRLGLKVGERSIHTDLPDHLAAGFDVAVAQGAKDLTLYNPFAFRITADAAYTGSLPLVSLKGNPDEQWKQPIITVQKETFAPEKVILTDLTLVSGEVNKDTGKEGQLVTVYAEGKSGGERQTIAKDYYAPRPAVAARPPVVETGKTPAAR